MNRHILLGLHDRCGKGNGEHFRPNKDDEQGGL